MEYGKGGAGILEETQAFLITNNKNLIFSLQISDQVNIRVRILASFQTDKEEIRNMTLPKSLTYQEVQLGAVEDNKNLSHSLSLNLSCSLCKMRSLD